MRLWTDSYLADTTHLTTIEHGAYLLLLMAAWRGKSHTLPNDDKLLARYAGVTARQWRRIRPTLEPLFKVEGGVWVNGRLLDEIAFVRRQRQLQSDKGKRSALKRLNRDATAVQPDGNRNSTPIPIPTYKEGNGGFEGSKKETADKKGRFWIARGTEQWTAWDSHYRKTQGVGPPCTTSRNEEGWFFESEFPQ